MTCRRSIKPSIRDADIKLTTVSNLLFSVMLIALRPVNFRNLLVSCALSLGQLYYQLVAEKVKNGVPIAEMRPAVLHTS